MVFTELLGAGIPYGDSTTEAEIFYEICNDKYVDRLSHISKKFDVIDFIGKRCWNEDHTNRQTFEELLDSLKAYRQQIGEEAFIDLSLQVAINHSFVGFSLGVSLFFVLFFAFFLYVCLSFFRFFLLFFV